MKIFYNGRRLDGKFDSFKCKANRAWKKFLWYSYFGVAAWLIFQAGGAFNPSVHFVQAEKEANSTAAVLQRIAKCESGNSHYDKNGQVLLRANTNGSVDVGKFQINSVWFAKATELGLDITKEGDNEAMALWIYENRGTEDWYSSKHCWQK